MQWSADVNAGFSEAEPWISVIDNYKEINAEKEMQDPDSIYSFYKETGRTPQRESGDL